MKPLIASLALITLTSPISALADLRQSAQSQEQIRAEANQLLTRLDDLLSEYSRNGLAAGEDYDSLKNVRDSLGDLSTREMEQAAALLTQAQAGAGATEDIAKAYAEQKDISLKLKQILAAHQRLQDVDALAKSVSQLAARQSANLSAAIDVRRLAAQDTSANGKSAVTASAQAQQAEQTDIAGEVKLLAGQLDQIAADSGEPKYKSAAGNLDDAQPLAASAATSLNTSDLEGAVSAESSAREKLVAVARALAPAPEPGGASSAEAGQLIDLARRQRAILIRTSSLTTMLSRVAGQQTQDAADRAMYDQLSLPAAALTVHLAQQGITGATPIDQIRNAPEMRQFLAARADALKREADAVRAGIASAQADEAALAAKAQIAAQDLAQLSKPASIPMSDALNQMNAASEALAQPDGNAAVQAETNALAQLAEAANLAARAAPRSQSDENRLRQLQQLQKQAQALAAGESAALQQAQHPQTPQSIAASAALQDDLAARTEALQEAAASESPNSPVATPLQNAAQAMQSAAQSLQNGSASAAAQAGQDGQKASQNLQAAAQQLAQAAAAAQREQQQLAAMEKQMQWMAKLIAGQQQTNLATAAAVANQGAPGPLAQQQAAVRKQTDTVRQSMAATAPDAANALDRAGASMGGAIQKLNDEGPDQAQPSQKSALDALAQAQDALADKIQHTAQDLGEADSPAATAAQREALDRAQAAAQAAQLAMNFENTGVTRSAGQQLSQAAQFAAALSALAQTLPQPARASARDAGQDFLAAAAASSGDRQQSQSQAAQGRQALQMAESALSQNQGGIGQLSQASPQSQQPGPSSQPGAGPPRTSGRSDGASDRGRQDKAGAAHPGIAQSQGAGQFLALPDRDRPALQQSQSEKYPPEYGPMVEQYMRSLSNDSGGNQ
ncbi:MAG: hypothetical protein ABSE62_11925 [Chthoniobacteraceae bacterium]|jgi:hypothetical protein